MSFGLTSFEGIFGLYALKLYGYGPERVGTIVVVIGIISATMQGVLTGPLSRRWGEANIIKVCRETPLTVMYNEDDDTYYLALTGGGMDLSQSIVRAYQILEKWVPISLLRNMSKQPELSVHGDNWLAMATQVKEQLAMDIGHLKDDVKRWDVAIGNYKKTRKARRQARRSKSSPGGGVQGLR